VSAPTSPNQAEVNVSGGSGTGTTIDTNQASRQIVTIYNNGPEELTVVVSSGAAPTITPGIGIKIYPGGSEWFYAGTGMRFYGRTAATNQVSGAATICLEQA
jgi:hypothetical protein